MTIEHYSSTRSNNAIKPAPFIKKFLFTLLVLNITSCVGNDKFRKVENIMASPVCLPEVLSDTTSIYKIVRYVKPSSCTSCQLNLGMWRILKKRLSKRYDNSVSIKFIIETNDTTDVNRLLSIYKFDGCAYVDSIGDFISKIHISRKLEKILHLY